MIDYGSANQSMHALSHGDGAQAAFGPNQSNDVQVKTFGGLLGRKNISFQRTSTERMLSGVARGHYMEKPRAGVKAAQSKAELETKGLNLDDIS